MLSVIYQTLDITWSWTHPFDANL